MGPLLTLKRFSRALIVYTFYYPLFIVYCSLSAVRGYDTAYRPRDVRLYAIEVDFYCALKTGGNF